MGNVRSLWATVVNNPAVFKTVNGWLTVFWVAMIPISVATGWVSTVEYVSALSIYALVTGHLSTWQAARVEVRQEQQEAKQDAASDADFDKIEAKVDDLHEHFKK